MSSWEPTHLMGKATPKTIHHPSFSIMATKFKAIDISVVNAPLNFYNLCIRISSDETEMWG